MSDPATSATLIDRDLDQVGLKDRSIRGVAITFASQGARFPLNFAFQVWLAHRLSASDFGVVAMAAPLLVFAGLFSDLGLTQATIQRPNITQSQLSFVFWVNAGLGAVLALVLILAAPLVANFYHEPRVRNVVVVLAAGLLVGCAYSQQLALFARRLEFGKLAIIDLTSTSLGWIMAVIAALNGAGYWSLLVSQVGSSIVAMFLAYAMTAWRPSLPRRADDWRSMISFGGDLTIANLADLLTLNMDNVLIGRFSGSVSLGFYDRAFRLLLLPVSQIAAPIGRVAQPLLARVRDQTEAYRRAYARLTDVAALLIMPPVLFAIVASDVLVPLLLGARWAPVAPIFRLLGIAALATPFGAGLGWLFFSQGRSKEVRNWALVRCGLAVSGFFIGIYWGVLGVCVSIVIVNLLLTPLQLFAVGRKGPVDGTTILAAVIPHLVALSVLIGVQLAWHATALPPVLKVLISAVAAYPVYVAGLALTRGGRRGVEDLWTEGFAAATRAISRR